jgi:hypothetical protein
MSIIANSLRPYWAQGLNDVSGNVAKGVSSWLAEENYQVYSPLKSKQFKLQLADVEPYLAALAADINRTAAAAFESIAQAGKNELFPRSNAWILIKSYYATFFAAHAILRMLGTGFISLEQPQTSSVNKIAKVYSAWHEDVKPGTFVSTFSGGSREVLWRRVDSSSGGVHERFWAFFKQFLDDLSKKLLINKRGATLDDQQVSAKLTELVDNLCSDSCPKGTWLSVVRNRVNYKHQYGAWYPYTAQHPSGTTEERLTRNWRVDPMTINLTSHDDRYLRRFQETCSFIIGCCAVLASDMATRCSKGRSFQNYGWLAITRFAQQRGTDP